METDYIIRKVDLNSVNEKDKIVIDITNSLLECLTASVRLYPRLEDYDYLDVVTASICAFLNRALETLVQGFELQEDKIKFINVTEQIIQRYLTIMKNLDS